MTNEIIEPPRPAPYGTRARTALYIQIAIVALMFIAGAVLYAYLPDMLPMHWGLDGQPNSWWPKTYGTWLVPGLAALFIILFPILQKIDPKSQNYPDFAKSWAVIQTSILGMLAYMYSVTLFVTLHPAYNNLVGRLVVFGIGVLFVILGNYMGKVRQNYFVGLRTPWTLNDPEIWQKSQRVAGWAFVLAGLVAIVDSIVWIYAPAIFFGVVLIIVIVPMVYSYWLSRKKKN